MAKSGEYRPQTALIIVITTFFPFIAILFLWIWMRECLGGRKVDSMGIRSEQLPIKAAVCFRCLQRYWIINHETKNLDKFFARLFRICQRAPDRLKGRKSDFKIIFHRRHINNWDVCRWHLTAIFGKCYKADEKETPGSVYHMEDKVKIFFWHPENYSLALIKREKRRKLIYLHGFKRGEKC